MRQLAAKSARLEDAAIRGSEVKSRRPLSVGAIFSTDYYQTYIKYIHHDIEWSSLP